MGPIGAEPLELFALELGKIATFASIYKYKPISTKLGHNVYEHLIMGQVIPDQ